MGVTEGVFSRGGGLTPSGYKDRVVNNGLGFDDVVVVSDVLGAGDAIAGETIGSGVNGPF